MRLSLARSGSFVTSLSAHRLYVWLAKRRSSSVRVLFVKAIRRSSSWKTRSPRASVFTFLTPRQTSLTGLSKISRMRTHNSKMTTIRFDLSSEKLRISLTKLGQRLIRRSSLLTNFKTNSQTKRVRVWLTWARSCKAIAWRSISSSVRTKSKMSASHIYPDWLRTKMSQFSSWRRRLPSLREKCTGFRRNTARRTTRDNESSSVSASMTPILKLGSIRWAEILLEISRKEKAVAGKEWIVGSNRPPRLLRLIREGLMIKMLREASKFWNSLRWNKKHLKSTSSPTGLLTLS